MNKIIIGCIALHYLEAGGSCSIANGFSIGSGPMTADGELDGARCLMVEELGDDDSWRTFSKMFPRPMQFCYEQAVCFSQYSFDLILKL